MGTKFGIVLGFGIGYVLGTRAGREKYEKIRAAASRLRSVPIVAAPLDKAGEALSDVVRVQGERITDKVADAVKERLFAVPPTHSSTQDETQENTATKPHTS
ncbi:YtxH domain-containing protein [Schaalia sp. lx-100]|uniref:YtxH domain-containing protein n=1 Tax=Schaalia sp. lx-100 TaxID=2899081 RepID=UPI001E28923F|nr:YtxH domain-containing protein [Schaalia sp. lx-100]MCD4557822.1 YtxH domain-containing protein [Schaalia sp. lx-100]